MTARLSAPQRREQLLNFALTVFADKGYHESSMNDIAEQAGVTKPVLYQHFASKRELYLALIHDVGVRMMDTITKATTNATSRREQTEQGIIAYFVWVAHDRNAFMLLFGSGARRDEEFAREVRNIERAAADAITPLIDAGITTAHKRILANGLVGLSEAVSRHLITEQIAFDPEIVGRQVAELAWAGLRGVGRK